jgi:hypothetical protein
VTYPEATHPDPEAAEYAALLREILLVMQARNLEQNYGVPFPEIERLARRVTFEIITELRDDAR